MLLKELVNVDALRRDDVVVVIDGLGREHRCRVVIDTLGACAYQRINGVDTSWVPLGTLENDMDYSAAVSAAKDAGLVPPFSRLM